MYGVQYIMYCQISRSSGWQNCSSPCNHPLRADGALQVGEARQHDANSTPLNLPTVWRPFAMLFASSPSWHPWSACIPHCYKRYESQTIESMFPRGLSRWSNNDCQCTSSLLLLMRSFHFSCRHHDLAYNQPTSRSISQNVYICELWRLFSKFLMWVYGTLEKTFLEACLKLQSTNILLSAVRIKN